MRIALLFGGASWERDVSIASGAQVLRALRERGHEVQVLDTTSGLLKPTEEEQLLTASVAVDPPEISDIPSSELTAQLVGQSHELRRADVVFVALHGGAGEDGTVQALFDAAGIRYTGSGHLASTIAMDKDISKKLFRAVGVPTPDWLMAPVNIQAVESELGFPVIVKPNKQGSTIGLTLVKRPEMFEEAVQVARRYDSQVMLERFIPGREFVVGVLDGTALAVGEIVPRHSEIFDYRSKYQVDGALEVFPAEISESQTLEIQRVALAAHQALRLGPFSRVDFRMDDEGTIWCLEANTLPGMTATSLLPQSAGAVGISFPELCERICLLA